MIAAAPVPAAARRPWSPDARDHLIYHLVKFGGQTQEQVASMQRIHQGTVSRIIDRYERWQAHADPREGGRLDPAERLRAQRWLTYERNELILASALRIAQAMEGMAELWKTVQTRQLLGPSTGEAEERTEQQLIDRSGVAARFLRLAFRVNMEQLKLVSQEAPPIPEPPSEEEITRQERENTEIAAEFAELERQMGEWRADDEEAVQPPSSTSQEAGDGADVKAPDGEGQPEAAAHADEGGMQEAHVAHNGRPRNSSANGAADSTCAQSASVRKKRRTAMPESPRPCPEAGGAGPGLDGSAWNGPPASLAIATG